MSILESGIIKRRKTGMWSEEEIKIIMAKKDNWKEKNMNKTLASKLVGRSAKNVCNWICWNRKNGLRG